MHLGGKQRAGDLCAVIESQHRQRVQRKGAAVAVRILGADLGQAIRCRHRARHHVEFRPGKLAFQHEPVDRIDVGRVHLEHETHIVHVVQLGHGLHRIRQPRHGLARPFGSLHQGAEGTVRLAVLARVHQRAEVRDVEFDLRAGQQHGTTALGQPVLQQQLLGAVDEGGPIVFGARGPGGFRILQRGRDQGLPVRAAELPDRLRRKHLPRQRRQLRPLLRRDPVGRLPIERALEALHAGQLHARPQQGDVQGAQHERERVADVRQQPALLHQRGEGVGRPAPAALVLIPGDRLPGVLQLEEEVPHAPVQVDAHHAPLQTGLLERAGGGTIGMLVHRAEARDPVGIAAQPAGVGGQIELLFAHVEPDGPLVEPQLQQAAGVAIGRIEQPAGELVDVIRRDQHRGTLAMHQAGAGLDPALKAEAEHFAHRLEVQAHAAAHRQPLVGLPHKERHQRAFGQFVRRPLHADHGGPVHAQHGKAERAHALLRRHRARCGHPGRDPLGFDAEQGGPVAQALHRLRELDGHLRRRCRVPHGVAFRELPVEWRTRLHHLFLEGLRRFPERLGIVPVAEAETRQPEHLVGVHAPLQRLGCAARTGHGDGLRQGHQPCGPLQRQQMAPDRPREDGKPVAGITVAGQIGGRQLDAVLAERAHQFDDAAHIAQTSGIEHRRGGLGARLVRGIGLLLGPEDELGEPVVHLGQQILRVGLGRVPPALVALPGCGVQRQIRTEHAGCHADLLQHAKHPVDGVTAQCRAGLRRRLRHHRRNKTAGHGGGRQRPALAMQQQFQFQMDRLHVEVFRSHVAATAQVLHHPVHRALGAGQGPLHVPGGGQEVALHPFGDTAGRPVKGGDHAGAGNPHALGPRAGQRLAHRRLGGAGGQQAVGLLRAERRHDAVGPLLAAGQLRRQLQRAQARDAQAHCLRIERAQIDSTVGPGRARMVVAQQGKPLLGVFLPQRAACQGKHLMLVAGHGDLIELGLPRERRQALRLATRRGAHKRVVIGQVIGNALTIHRKVPHRHRRCRQHRGLADIPLRRHRRDCDARPRGQASHVAAELKREQPRAAVRICLQGVHRLGIAQAKRPQLEVPQALQRRAVGLQQRLPVAGPILLAGRSGR